MPVPWLRAAIAVAAMAGALAADTARPDERLVATPEPADRNTALPRETECPVPLADNAPAGDWSPAEHWAWDERLCLGQEADFAERNGLDQKTCRLPSLPAGRRLSETFLRTVLFYEPFRSAWGQHGLHVVCAYFAEDIDLSFGTFADEIMIRDSYLAGSLTAERLVMDDTFALTDSRIAGSFLADGLHVNGNLDLSNSHFGNRSADADAPGEQASGEIEEACDAPTPAEAEQSQDAATESSDPAGTIALENAEIAGNFLAGVDRVVVSVTLEAHHLVTGGSVRLDNGNFSSVGLSDAEVAVDLSAVGADIDNLVTARVHIGSQLLLDGVDAEKIDLSSARIDGGIHASQVILHRMFNGTAMRVLGDVKLQSLTACGDIIVNDADIRGSLDISRGTLNAPLLAARLSVGGNVRLGDGASFLDTLDFTRATIGGDLTLVDGYFHNHVDLSRGQVDGDFLLSDQGGFGYARWPSCDDPDTPDTQSDCSPQDRGGDTETPARGVSADEPASGKPAPEELAPEELAPEELAPEELASDEPAPGEPLSDCEPPPDFLPSQAELILTDLSVGTLSDHSAAWCDLRGRVDMVGFRYERLGWVANDYGVSSDQWVAWLIGWLSLQENGEDKHAHQPYRHLADTLRAQNFHREADSIMEAANDARRDAESTPWRTQLLLSISGFTLRYGYDYWRAILSGFLLIFAGALVVRYDRDRTPELNLWQQILYSVYVIFPVRVLRHDEKIQLGQMARNYFIFHKVVGLFLWIILFTVIGGEFDKILR